MSIKIEEIDFKQVLDIIKDKIENESSCFVDLYKSLKISQKKHTESIIETQVERIAETEQRITELTEDKQALLNLLKIQKTELTKYNKQLIDDLYVNRY